MSRWSCRYALSFHLLAAFCTLYMRTTDSTGQFNEYFNILIMSNYFCGFFFFSWLFQLHNTGHLLRMIILFPQSDLCYSGTAMEERILKFGSASRMGQQLALTLSQKRPWVERSLNLDFHSPNASKSLAVEICLYRQVWLGSTKQSQVEVSFYFLSHEC